MGGARPAVWDWTRHADLAAADVSPNGRAVAIRTVTNAPQETRTAVAMRVLSAPADTPGPSALTDPCGSVHRENVITSDHLAPDREVSSDGSDGLASTSRPAADRGDQPLRVFLGAASLTLAIGVIAWFTGATVAADVAWAVGHCSASARRPGGCGRVFAEDESAST